MSNMIKQQRIKLNMTQKELADQLGVSTQYMNKIERGKVKPSFRLAIRMAKILQCQVGDIFFD